MRLIKSLALSFLTLVALKAHAIDQMYNWNGLEFVTSGNVTHVHPASPESTKLRGGWVLDISDVEPKASASHAMPYKNTSNALVTVKPHIDPKKVSASAASKIKEAAKAAGPNPYLAVASLGCAVFCDALIDWGVNQLHLGEDGSISAVVPDPNQTPDYSDGSMWGYGSSSPIYLTKLSACSAYQAYLSSRPTLPYPTAGYEVSGSTCYVHSIYSQRYYNVGLRRDGSSSCPSGESVAGNVCGASPSGVDTPLQTYLQSNYIGKGWDHHWAKMTAAIVAAGGNVFTDGTSTDITGPAIVPVSTSETKTSVSLVPGTTTPAPAGHTGPTESGTQTTTTTTTAHNKYNPAPMTSGSSGSPASGPSMETTQKTTTTTTITNNVTNITNIVNETTTEKDEAPEEAPTDTPFADLPELYKQKYPDGLIGVLRTQTAAMKATPLFQLPMQLMGDLPQTGQCPSWQLDLSLATWASFGTYNVGADCAIWDFAGWVIVISAFLLARQLIFGG
ncbi:hypothetical protein [Comamonas aquatica]|uniref:Uncharacterized protein n=1 Tax=Comamonas aquatica TaxID=225991 RepID=A0AA42L8F8_9BURK|nr:hypothetical protein [Comamonas aquatica]MDH0364516.1 hypothetical protein [Comamonas aquatica]